MGWLKKQKGNSKTKGQQEEDEAEEEEQGNRTRWFFSVGKLGVTANTRLTRLIYFIVSPCTGAFVATHLHGGHGDFG